MRRSLSPDQDPGLTHMPTYEHEVVVIGSGVAGLSAALAAHASGARVAIVTDRAAGRANSTLAQGGLHVPEGGSGEDRMVADMLATGETCDADRVTRFVREVRPVVDALIDRGLEFDRNADGTLARKRAGGMSEARILSIGDRIGAPLMRLMLSTVRGADIDLIEHHAVASIEPLGDRLRLHTASEAIDAKAVVCATGGTAWFESTQQGAPTSNPANGNHHLATHLGELLDQAVAPHFQFQPFGDLDSLDADNVGKLIPETIVGYDVQILDSAGDLVVDPRAGRLAVTEAMHKADAAGRAVTAANGRTGFVLTLSGVGADQLAASHPTLARRLERDGRAGADVLVAPFYHYQLGGFDAAPDGATAISGLFLTGEMVGGLHGRNRLMGNGLTESLVLGDRVGRAAADWVSATT